MTSNLEKLLSDAFDAGVQYGISSHRDFKQINLPRDEYVASVLRDDFDEHDPNPYKERP